MKYFLEFKRKILNSHKNGEMGKNCNKINFII